MAWLGQVLNELGILENPTSVAEDNIESMGWSEGGADKHFNRRKHIDLSYHYLVEKVREGIIRLQKVSMERMEGDFLTRSLRPSCFENRIAKEDFSNLNKTDIIFGKRILLEHNHRAGMGQLLNSLHQE